MDTDRMYENGNKLIKLRAILLVAILTVLPFVAESADSLLVSDGAVTVQAGYEQAVEGTVTELGADKSTPHCMECGSLLNGTRYTDGMGRYVCPEHLSEVSRCYSCQRFVSKENATGSVYFSDGGSLCSSCVRTAVTDLTRAKGLMEQARQQLAANGVDIPQELTLALVDHAELLRHAESGARHPLGLTRYRRDLTRDGSFHYRDFQVMVLGGLPEAHLKEVLAHELMHVWILINRGEWEDPALIEGSCQYAAMLVLRSDKSKPGQFYLNQLLTNDAPIYGSGLQEVVRIVEREGIAGWLDYLTSERTPPQRASTEQ